MLSMKKGETEGFTVNLNLNRAVIQSLAHGPVLVQELQEIWHQPISSSFNRSKNGYFKTGHCITVNPLWIIDQHSPRKFKTYYSTNYIWILTTYSIYNWHCSRYQNIKVNNPFMVLLWKRQYNKISKTLIQRYIVINAKEKIKQRKERER